MSWWQKLLQIIMGLFSGVLTAEKLGQQESENVGLKKYIQTEQDVQRARDGVDPGGVRNDPDNQGPASR